MEAKDIENVLRELVYSYHCDHHTEKAMIGSAFAPMYDDINECRYRPCVFVNGNDEFSQVLIYRYPRLK